MLRVVMRQNMRCILKKIVLWLSVILLSCQIFAFSADTKAESSKVSQKITKAVVNVVKKATPSAKQGTSWEKRLFRNCHKIVRKSAHFTLYAILAVLTLLLARSYQISMKFSCAISAAYCLLFAISDEIHQLFVDGRSGQFSDVLLDFSGALVGIGLVSLVRYLYLRQKKIS